MHDEPLTFLAFYQQSLRTPLFTGFLTMSGFLFSAKAFLITNLIKEVYSTDHYQKRVKDLRKYKQSLKITAPLKDLADYLQWSICLSLTASISQMTVGLIPYSWAAGLCLTIAGVAAASVFVAVYLLRQNIADWIETVEDKAKAPKDGKETG